MGSERVVEDIKAFRWEVYVRVPKKDAELAYGEIAEFQDELASLLASSSGYCAMSGYAGDWIFACGFLPDLLLIKQGMKHWCNAWSGIFREMTPDSPTWPPEVAATLEDVDAEGGDGD